MTPRESNDLLYADLIRGGKSARDKLIETNVSLVIFKVGQFINRFPAMAYLREELVGEGMVGLVTAVDKMANAPPHEKPNPTGFISHWITFHIGEAVDKEFANGASARTVRNHRKSAEADFPRAVPFTGELETILEDHDPSKLIELRDLIYGCCVTETEREVISLRESGHTYQEIAKLTGFSLTSVFLITREVYQRFLDESEMGGEA